MAYTLISWIFQLDTLDTPLYSPVFVKDRSCRTSDLPQKRIRISVCQKRLLTHLQKAEFSIEFHHIYLPWGWVKSLNAQEWDGLRS